MESYPENMFHFFRKTQRNLYKRTLALYPSKLNRGTSSTFSALFLFVHFTNCLPQEAQEVMFYIFSKLTEEKRARRLIVAGPINRTYKKTLADR